MPRRGVKRHLGKTKMNTLALSPPSVPPSFRVSLLPCRLTFHRNLPRVILRRDFVDALHSEIPRGPRQLVVGVTWGEPKSFPGVTASPRLVGGHRRSPEQAVAETRGGWGPRISAGDHGAGTAKGHGGDESCVPLIQEKGRCSRERLKLQAECYSES